MKLELPIVLQTAFMLTISNCFMTFAWYGHLRNLNHKAWYIAALISWGIAIFYMRQPLKADYFYAGLCIIGAVYFIFRS